MRPGRDATVAQAVAEPGLGGGEAEVEDDVPKRQAGRP
jgi:hypothetical protein